MKILLVEDNQADARLFAELLAELPGGPFALTSVDTLDAALRVLGEHDVVFLDLSLPDAHGLSTVTRMVGAARQVPIVVLTGMDDDKTAVEAMKAGAQDYLTKGEITASLIARAARYAVERKLHEQNARQLALSERAAERASFISSLMTAINASFELAQTLPQVARLLVPTLADHVSIETQHDGSTYRVAYPDGVCEPAASLEVALESRGRTLGTLRCTMGSSRRSFDADLRQLADEVAGRIALGIDNAMLYAAAQRAIRGRDELLAVVSHDLRNPLNTVALALQMMEAEPAAAKTALPRAKRGADRMLRLIEDLLDLARIDSGTLRVEPGRTDVAALLDDTLEAHRVLASDRRITLVRDFERGAGQAIADRHRLSQALANLVGNALKFTQAGGAIRIGGEARGDRIALWVSDTGHGIPPEHLGHIFDRFWQSQRRRDGVGLGLAIVKGIVDAHGGELEVESTVGIGTTFRILLPRAEQRTSAELRQVGAIAP